MSKNEQKVFFFFLFSKGLGGGPTGMFFLKKNVLTIYDCFWKKSHKLSLFVEKILTIYECFLAKSQFFVILLKFNEKVLTIYECV